MGHQYPITAIRLNTNDFRLLFQFNSNILLVKAGCYNNWVHCAVVTLQMHIPEHILFIYAATGPASHGMLGILIYAYN